MRNAAEENYEKLNRLIDELSGKEMCTPFDFSADEKKKEARELLAGSHGEVLKRIQGFSNEELFVTKAFSAVGGSTLGSYFVSSTSSHYDWAMKKIKAHRKNCSLIK